MVQRRGRLRFLDETAAAVGIAGVVAGQYFDSDKPVQARVLGLIDIPHATGAQLFDELILQDSSTDHNVLYSGTLTVWHSRTVCCKKVRAIHPDLTRGRPYHHPVRPSAP